MRLARACREEYSEEDENEDEDEDWDEDWDERRWVFAAGRGL